VTAVVDNAVMARKQTGKKVIGIQHLCLDKGYKSPQEKQNLIRRGYVLHIPYKKKKKEVIDDKGNGKQQQLFIRIKYIRPKDGLWKGQTLGTTSSETAYPL
jgi:hypothetical protein